MSGRALTPDPAGVGLPTTPAGSGQPGRRPHSLDHCIAIGATHIGVTRAEYRRHLEAGEKWCAGHHDWHPRTTDVFYGRSTKRDGLDNVCKEIVRARSRVTMRRLYARRTREEAAS